MDEVLPLETFIKLMVTTGTIAVNVFLCYYYIIPRDRRRIRWFVLNVLPGTIIGFALGAYGLYFNKQTLNFFMMLFILNLFSSVIVRGLDIVFSPRE